MITMTHSDTSKGIRWLIKDRRKRVRDQIVNIYAPNNEIFMIFLAGSASIINVGHRIRNETYRII